MDIRGIKCGTRTQAKGVRVLFSLMLALCTLTGCRQYSAGEERQLVSAGRTMMQDYLNAYIPEGKVLTAEAFTEEMLGQGTMIYLTEYVYGSYRDADGEWKYYANTETGMLYRSLLLICPAFWRGTTDRSCM